MDPANDEPHAALDQLSEFIARREAEAASALIEAKQASGKEPFTIEALQAAYNLSLDLGTHPLTPAAIADYERRYYLTTPTDIRTVAQFGEYLYCLYVNEAG